MKNLLKNKNREKNRETQETKLDTVAFAGPIGRRFNIWDGSEDEDNITSAELEQHVPAQSLHPLDNTNFRALSARTSRTQHLPNLYANPMQHLDYKIYQSLLKTTFIGALSDALVKYLVGSGFKPELELINPDEDPEKNKLLIDQNQEIITRLRKIDNQLEENDMDELDVSFKQKIASMIMSSLMYNRGALIFDYEKPVIVDGKTYDNIPTNLHFAHALDLGIIEINPMTRRLKKVQWRHASDFIPIKDMIYLWNPVTSSKVHNSWFYGTSILSPMISASKLLRQLLSEDFPAMAQTAWAGLFLLVVKNDGNTTESKQREYSNVAKSLVPGKPGILVKDPEDVESHDIKFEPKIAEFQSLFESMIKLCISIMGLPQVGFYDEAAANRSTMVGKIQLTMRTTIEPMREWIGEAIVQQWYARWFKTIYKEDAKILETFRIKLSWNDLHIDEWYDSIEAALELDSRRELKDSEFGDKIGMPDYSTMVKPEAETHPGGDAGNKIQMTDSKSGDSLEIKKRRGSENK